MQEFNVLTNKFSSLFISHVIINMQVFGSAGVIGNPMGFIRSVGLGIKDFLSAPARSVLQVFNVMMIEGCPFFLISVLKLWHHLSEPYWTHYRHGTRHYKSS